MICSNCGTENEPGRKFCGECATRLAAVCPSCGAPNAPTAKFCGECATPLVAGAVPAARPTAGRETAHPQSPAGGSAPVAERRLV